MKKMVLLLIICLGWAIATNVPAQMPDKNDPLYHSKGDQKRSYKFPENGESVSYRTYVPTTWSADKKLPMIVVLHGGGLDENAPFDRSPANLKDILIKTAEAHAYIVVAPRGYGLDGGYGADGLVSTKGGKAAKPSPGTPGGPVGPGRPQKGGPKGPSLSPEERRTLNARSERDVINVTEIVAQEYNVDRFRIFLMGNSMGAIGTTYLAGKYPEKWLAIVPSEGGSDPEKFGDWLKSLQVKGIRIILKDGEPNPKYGDMVRQLNEKGIVTEFVVVPNSNHSSAWYMVLPQTFDFFDRIQK